MSDGPTLKEKEERLEQQDKMELQQFRRSIPNAKKAADVEFIGERKETGRLQVFQIQGSQPGVVHGEFGFVSDEAVELAQHHLKQLLPDGDEESV